MKNRKYLLILISITLLSMGCKANNKNAEKIKVEDKAPKSLSELTKNLDEMLEAATSIERINLGIATKEELKHEEKPKDTQMAPESQDSQGGDSNQGNGQGQSSGGQSSGQGQPQQPGAAEEKQPSEEQMKDKQLKELWKKIDRNLENIHPLWNSYEAEAQKKGATTDRGDKFEASLNKVTKAIEDRSIMDIYDFGSQAILDLKPFYELYTDEIRGDTSQIRHDAYQAYIKASQEKIEEAVKLLENKDENINKIRLKLEGKDDKIKELEKLILSLGDMRKSFGENSKRLFMLKKDVVINNLKKLEE